MATKVLFLDRDGTLVEEPEDEQVDSPAKVRLMPGVIPALLRARAAGFELVIVSNQDGLGTESFPSAAFETTQAHIRSLFASQGIEFAAEFFCPHRAADGCGCRKPKAGLLKAYLASTDVDRRRSAVIGDRDSDAELAEHLGLRSFRVAADGSEHERWERVVHALLVDPRVASVERRTRETSIRVDVDLDRTQDARVSTGIGFFDHMLEQLGKHGGFALAVRCEGDLDVDEHHTVEDVALALGAALSEALGDKRGIARYGFLLPMDEAQARVGIDLGGRPYAVFEGTFARERVGGLPTELVPHFFRSLAESLGAAIHIHVEGANAHHMIEACFKGVARSLRQALRREGSELPSTKGVL
ncbi:MAG: bifunctional histidinol-phosphatase/imidazoleglycerol-phosphate dehydratase HisB [Rhodospirillaceae bacterium]|nr:bifunctional histidinol-phosphatase/imidazoleglycerol-phosphate dehydratase HisB [Rhodospirillaceae bacterium]